MTTSSAREVVDRYFAALQRRDFAAMRPLLRDDVSFRGALGTTATADEFIRGLERLTATMTRAERLVVWAEGDDVCQIYELTFATPPVTVPIAQWLTLREGRIAKVRVFFDPRPLLPPTAS